VVVHCSAQNDGVIGNGVTVAHNAVVHACRVGDECLIGVGAIIFDGAVVGKHSIIGVGCVVPGGQKIPAGSVAVGVPAKVTRRVNDGDLRMLKSSWQNYVRMSRSYLRTRAYDREL
ncbi:gamma carbonic anhydrase family protein, partial [Candidatus Bathyarchaeota archaeon]